jgi:hypothetical protein
VDVVDGDVTIKKLTALAQALACVRVIQLAVDTVSFTVVIANHTMQMTIATATSQVAAQLVALCTHKVDVEAQYVTKAAQLSTTTPAAQWLAVAVALVISTDAVVLVHSAIVFAPCMATVNNLVYADQQLCKAVVEHAM